MPTDADRLLADGIPVTFSDGVHHLRFTMRSLKMLEDTFGGVEAVGTYLAGVVDGSATKRVGPLMDLLAAGLAHEHLTSDEVLDLAESFRFHAYLEACIDGINLAFPAASEDDQAGEAPAGESSTGAASTSSPPSAMAAATATSGA